MPKKPAKAKANRSFQVKSLRGRFTWLGSLFRFVQAGADGDGAGRIHGAVALLDVLDLPFFVDHDSCALRPLIFSALSAVGFQYLGGRQDFFLHVTEEREGYANLFCERGVCGGTVYADSEDDGVACFELGHISLIGLQFFRSAAGESQNIKS